MFSKYIVEDTVSNRIQGVTQINSLPIFFIPGIINNSSDYANMIPTLYQLEPNRPFYLFHDKRLDELDKPIENEEEKQSLTNLLVKLKNEIMQIYPYAGHFPIFLVGFSYGASISVLLAQHLKKEGYDVKVYVIDGVAPHLSKNYFASYQTNKMPIIQHLTQMINFIALNFAGLNKIVEEVENMNFDGLSLEAAIKKLEKKIIKINSLEKDIINNYIKIHYFSAIMQIVTANLEHLIHYQADPSLDLLEEVTVLLTNETINKYKNYSNPHDLGGWLQHAKKIIHIDKQDLNDQTHTNLVAKMGIAEIVAFSINDFIKNSLTAKQFKILYKKYLCDELLNFNNENDTEDELRAHSLSEPTEPIDIRSGIGSEISSGYNSQHSDRSSPDSTDLDDDSGKKRNPLLTTTGIGIFANKPTIANKETTNRNINTKELQRIQSI